MSKRILVIMNPVAGVKKTNKYLTEILSIFSENDYDISVQMTTPARGADKIVEKYGKGKDIIACIGGDGTFNEMVSGLINNNLHPKIGYIPSGSTNDFANGMKLTTNPITAVNNIIEENSTVLDVGSFNGRIFTYTASFGIFTKTSYNTPRDLKNTLGYLAYVLEGSKELSSIKSFHIKLKTEDKEYEGDYIFGAICNSMRLGGGFVNFKNSGVDMNDGLLEILLIKFPKNAADATQALIELRQSKFTAKHFEFFSASEITIETDDEIDWTIDGEYQKGDNKIHINCINNAISIITKKKDK